MAFLFSWSPCVFATMGLLVCCSIVSAQVSVSGITYSVDRTGQYTPLGSVQIQAYRNQAPLLSKPAKSDPNTGKFSFTISDGDPFDVLFFGIAVPQLTQLAGVKGKKNEVFVVLLDAAQYTASQKAKRLPLNQYAKCVVSQLPPDDRATTSIIEQFNIRP